MTGRDGLLIVIADLGSGGAQQVASQLANHWAAEGRRVGVVTLAGPQADFFQLDRRVERIVAGGIGDSASAIAGAAANLRRLRHLRRAMKAFGGACLLSFIAPTNVLTVLAARGLGYRVVISERNDPARQSFGRAWDLLRRGVYPMADMVTANSRGALKALETFVPGPKLAYLPNPLRSGRETGRSRRREKLVLNIGRLHPQKGQDVLIRAFAGTKQLKDWRLAIVGEGPSRSALQALAKELGVVDRVAFPGRADDPFAWYGRAGLFALPSRHEGMPNVLLEAMSAGLPVIVSDATPDAGDLVADGREGLIVPVEDAGALGRAMARLALDARLRRRMGGEARKRARRFELDQVVSLWERILWPGQAGGAQRPATRSRKRAQKASSPSSSLR